VDLLVREHTVFRREGVDLFCDVPAPFTTLVLGGEVAVPTLQGPETIKIPAGTAAGTPFRLRGRGVSHLGRRGKGDLVVLVQARTPARLNKRQRELYRELAEIEAPEVEREERGLFDKVKDLLMGS